MRFKRNKQITKIIKLLNTALLTARYFTKIRNQINQFKYLRKYQMHKNSIMVKILLKWPRHTIIWGNKILKI